MHQMAHTVVSRRRFTGAALASVALAALSACSSGESGERGSAAVVERPLTVGMRRPVSIDPALATDASALTVVWQLFDALMSYDFETEELSCLAADRYEAASDAQGFTFHLREATFHDGTPVTSSDFKRAWERIVSPRSAVNEASGATPYAYLLSLVEGYDDVHSGAASNLSGVTCPDDMTLVVRLSIPYADFPYVLAHPVLVPVPEAAEKDAAAFAQKPVGNGPYQLAAEWKSGSGALALSRYDGYDDTPPTLDRVRFEVEADTASSYRAFQTEDLDVSLCPLNEAGDAASSLGRSEDGRTLGEDGRLACVTGLSTSMLACNCAAAPLDDANVRRALSLAIDRAYLADTLFRGTRLPADGVVPPTVHGYREGAWAYATFDADRAAELLEERFPLEEDGDARDLSIRLAYDTDGGHSEVMKAIADNLSDLGVDCKLEPLEADALRDRIAQGDFDLARVDWTADAPVMDNVLFPLFFSSNAGGTNVSRFQNAAVDEQLALARTELDETTRLATLQDVDSMVGEECPVIPLLYHASVYVASKRVEHLTVGPQGRLNVATSELAD